MGGEHCEIFYRKALKITPVVRGDTIQRREVPLRLEQGLKLGERIDKHTLYPTPIVNI
jgi:hypothetical protein